jgi:hypothetical protein
MAFGQTRLGADYVRNFWRDKRPVRRLPAPILDPAEFTLTNTPQGLGDSILLTHHALACAEAKVPGHAYTPAPHWPVLRDFCPWLPPTHVPRFVSLCDAVASWDLGPGHNVQRCRRLFGLPAGPVLPARRRPLFADVVPLGHRVSLHFDAGPHADWQRQHLHPRARQLYPENRVVVREFIEAHPELSFIEFGNRPTLRHDRVEDATGRPLAETIRLMAECTTHLGIVSGPMHLAAALGLRLIVVLNFPHPSQLCLPALVDTGVVESEWLYPEAMHLHQDADSPHWPRFGRASLERAFAGQVYPYGEPVAEEEFGKQEDRKGRRHE